jgi:hypothetical protein
MQELWKPIKDYEGLYEVSNLGRIKAFPRKGNHYKEPTIMKQFKYKTGYMYVSLSKGGKAKKYKVYRLVAEAFIPNPNDYKTINHIDENKENNCVENLEWCTTFYNNQYSKAKKVEQYDKLGNLVAIWTSARTIERVLGIDHTLIGNYCKDKNNKEWRYANANK